MTDITKWKQMDALLKFKVLFHLKKKNPEGNKVQEFKLILQGQQERRKSASNFHKYLSSSSYLQQHKLFAACGHVTEPLTCGCNVW